MKSTLVRQLALTVVAVGILAACGPASLPDPAATPTVVAVIAPTTAAPTAEPSATPLVVPSATPSPSTPWGSFPGPIEPSTIEVPPSMLEVPFPEGTVNTLLLGSDQRPGTGGWRTDTILILTLDSKAGTATLLSIPRDLYVYIPGWRVERINTSDARGGFDLDRLTILYNFGIRVDHWVRVDFSSFVSAVDMLGGIDVESTSYLNDECGHTWWSYGPGTYHLDGFAALCYARMRETSSDFDRLRRQQEVLLGIFGELTSADGLTRITELYSQFSSVVDTDLTLDNLLPLVTLATTIAGDSSRIHWFSIGPEAVEPWRVPSSGAQVLLPNRDAIAALLQSAYGQ